MTGRKKSPEYAAPALDHGLDILEALSASPVPLSLTDLARTLDYAPSGLFRLMARLERRRYVARDDVSGKYNLTLKLFELSHTHSPVENLMRVAQAPMRDLAAEVGESVHLSMLSHGKLVVLLDVGSPAQVRISIEAGSQFPPVETTSGKLLLACSPSEEREALLERDPEFAAMNAKRKVEFHRELELIRRKQFAISGRSARSVLKDLAVMVGNPVVGQAAALTIACLNRGRREQTPHLVKALQECAARITLAQGLSYDRRAIL